MVRAGGVLGLSLSPCLGLGCVRAIPTEGQDHCRRLGATGQERKANSQEAAPSEHREVAWVLGADLAQEMTALEVSLPGPWEPRPMGSEHKAPGDRDTLPPLPMTSTVAATKGNPANVSE